MWRYHGWSYPRSYPHKAPHGAEGSVDGEQKKPVCDHGGARDQLPLCCPISTQNSESENYDFGLSLPGC